MTRIHHQLIRKHIPRASFKAAVCVVKKQKTKKQQLLCLREMGTSEKAKGFLCSCQDSIRSIIAADVYGSVCCQNAITVQTSLYSHNMDPEAGIYYFLLFSLSVMPLSLVLTVSLLSAFPFSYCCYLYLPSLPYSLLSWFVVLLLGSQLGAMEGTSNIPRLHRDEDPTCGNVVQQKEAIFEDQGEKKQNLKCPQVVKWLKTEAKTDSAINIWSH